VVNFGAGCRAHVGFASNAVAALLKMGAHAQIFSDICRIRVRLFVVMVKAGDQAA
jgi:hypothetical protein